MDRKERGTKSRTTLRSPFLLLFRRLFVPFLVWLVVVGIAYLIVQNTTTLYTFTQIPRFHSAVPNKNKQQTSLSRQET